MRILKSDVDKVARRKVQNELKSNALFEEFSTASSMGNTLAGSICFTELIRRKSRAR